MLLFGFSVLAVVLCVLPGDVFSGALGTRDQEDNEQKNDGIFSKYCQKRGRISYSWLPPNASQCCTELEMQCKHYINPGEAKFGVRNTDSWPLLECGCERVLYDCLEKKIEATHDKDRAKLALIREMCFKATGCEDKSTLECTPQYRVLPVKSVLPPDNTNTTDILRALFPNQFIEDWLKYEVVNA